MKIIDAHIHYAGWDGFNETAAESGQVNTVEGVADNFRRNGVVMAVAMGAGRNGEDPAVCRPMTPNLAGNATPEHYGQPPGYIAYCAGVDSGAITPENTKRSLEEFERYLQTPQCVGLKFYPGYHHLYLSDRAITRSSSWRQPATCRSSSTRGTRPAPAGHVKYAHPLTVD